MRGEKVSPIRLKSEKSYREKLPQLIATVAQDYKNVELASGMLTRASEKFPETVYYFCQQRLTLKAENPDIKFNPNLDSLQQIITSFDPIRGIYGNAHERVYDKDKGKD